MSAARGPARLGLRAEELHVDDSLGLAVGALSAPRLLGPGGALSIWDLRAGVMISALPGHSNSVCCLAHDAASDVLVSGSSDHTLRSWRVGEAKAKGSSGVCTVM